MFEVDEIGILRTLTASVSAKIPEEKKIKNKNKFNSSYIQHVLGIANLYQQQHFYPSAH